jgi:hypothetical protein
MNLSEGFNYLGTIDDVAVRFPWRFTLTESALNHSLITQLIDGRPILLNDGYLVQHAIARQAVIDQQSLLWELMRVGYVRVMARGGDRYTLDEMPSRMQKVRSFFDLIHGQVGGVEWPVLQRALQDADGQLRPRGYLVDWPAFESGSGFAAFARRIRARGSQPRSLGMGRAVKPAVLNEFLDRFIDKMANDPVGPRDTWEKLAIHMARTSSQVDDAPAFVRSLMNFATETYHYNMGVMLAAHYKVPVSVETQTSPAFDDLLIRPDVMVDELPIVPRLNAPRVLATVDPKRLASIVSEPGSRIFEARTDWMARRASWERRRPAQSAAGRARARGELRDLQESGKAYAALLTGLVGKQVRYEQAEGMFHTVVGAVVKEGGYRAATAAGMSTAAAAAAAGAPAWGVVAAGVAAGYVVSTTQKKLLSGVVRKFRVQLLEKQFIPPEWIQRSQRVISRINARRAPSSIDLEPGMAHEIERELRPYVPG